MRRLDITAGQRGITLVEILIALAILGILMIIGVTNFRRLNEKYRVEVETKQFYADLMDARGRAMQRNRWFFVKITPTGYMTYEDGPLPEGDGWPPNSNDTLVTNVTVRYATIFSGVGSDFGFDRDGIANDSGTIRLESNAQPDYDCITVQPTRIKMGQYVGGTCIEK